MKTLLLEKREGVAIVTMNRPEALNALNTDMLKELGVLAKELAQDQSIGAVVFTGAGKSFVAGADIGEMANLSGAQGRDFGVLGQEVFRVIELMKKPTIAAINGFALGGGCELAMSCDLRLAGEKAKFGQPEVGLGITPGFSATVRLPKLVGVAKAKELIFTGKIIDAKEAERLGLVNQVIAQDNLLEEALKMAKEILKKAPLAVQYAKEAINRTLEVDIDTGNSIESAYFGLCFSTKDQKTGMSSFLKKETPKFQGK